MSNELKDAIDDIVMTIQEKKEYQRYLLAKEQMMENRDIESKIKKIKELQKQAIKLEVKKKYEDVKLIDQEIAMNLESLQNYPIYNEYISLQEELDDLFQSIKAIIDSYIQSKIN